MARASNNGKTGTIIYREGGGTTSFLLIAAIILLILGYTNLVSLDESSKTVLQILGFIFLVPFLCYVVICILCLFFGSCCLCSACCAATLGVDFPLQPQPEEV